jgi:hypothetical protein
MRMPFKAALLNIRRGPVRWIIIHHTAEIYEAPESRIDNAKFQMKGLVNGVLERSDPDINYHYVVDKIKDDYMPIVCRPVSSLCEWPDIHDDINKRAIHIAMMGSYDFKVPERRLYEILSYRLISPMIKIYGLTPKRVKFHRDVSTKKDITCPGDFADQGKLEATIRRFMITK